MLNDPSIVSSSVAVLRQDNSYEDIFREGRYPGPYVEYSWPLDLTAQELSYQFVKPHIIFSDRDTPISSEIRNVSELLVGRIKLLRNLLTEGRAVARGTYAMTGVVGEVDKVQWTRSDLWVDVRSSDLLGMENYKSIIKWSGLTLYRASANTIKKLPARAKRNEGSKDNTYRASIAAAIDGLWPMGIPAGLSAKKRDQMINDWQHDNGRQNTSSKTIQRYFSGK